MPNETSPDPQLPDAHRARQRLILQVAIVFLIIAAVVVGGFITRIALPLRLFVAATDLIAAAALWLVLRQKFPPENR